MTRKTTAQTLPDSLKLEIDLARQTLSDLKANWIHLFTGDKADPTEAWNRIVQIYNTQQIFYSEMDGDDFIEMCDGLEMHDLLRLYNFSIEHLEKTAETNSEQYIPHVHGLLDYIYYIRNLIKGRNGELERVLFIRTLYVLAMNHATSFFTQINPNITKNDGCLYIDNQPGIPIEQLLFYLDIRQQILSMAELPISHEE